TLKKDTATNALNYTRAIDPASGRTTFTCNACHVAGKTTKVGAMIDNIALVQKGGESGSANSYTVSKEWVSHVDFARPVVHTGAGPTLRNWNASRAINVMDKNVLALPPEGSRDASARPIGSKFLDERMGSGGSVFDIDGIRFGLEICLDHAKNRLTGNERVSIQLVPSCGMSWKSWKCLPGGLYFGVDGSTPTTQCGIQGWGGTLNQDISACSAGGDIVVYQAVTIA